MMHLRRTMALVLAGALTCGAALGVHEKAGQRRKWSRLRGRRQALFPGDGHLDHGDLVGELAL